MPCYLRGKIQISNFNSFQETVREKGQEVKLENGVYMFYGKGGGLIGAINQESLIKELNNNNISQRMLDLIQEYSVKTIKMSVQKRGWKIQSINKENNKVIIRVRE